MPSAFSELEPVAEDAPTGDAVVAVTVAASAGDDMTCSSVPGSGRSMALQPVTRSVEADASSGGDAAGATQPHQHVPEVSAVLVGFSERLQALGEANPAMDASAALPALIALLDVRSLTPHIDPAAGDAASDAHQAAAASALAQLMARSESNRVACHACGGTDALVAVLKAGTASAPAMCNAASHALHMLVRSPELCAAVADAGAVAPLCAMAAQRDEMLEGAIPAAGALCNLAESSAQVRAQVRAAGGCDALASLVIVSGGDSTAAKVCG